MEIVGGNEPIDAAFSSPGIDVFVRSTPHVGESQGGDVYFVSLCGAGFVSRLLVADVSGHGERVASVAQALRVQMRKSIGTPDQRRLARLINHAFASDAGRGHFVTAVIATYFAPTHQMIVCNAGHPPPLWWSASDKKWRPLRSDAPRTITGGKGPRNLPFGVIEPTEYMQFAIGLEEGDLVLIYTDALIEARNEAGEFIGVEGLQEAVESLNAQSPAEVLDELGRALLSRGFTPPTDDDATVVLIHSNGADPPKPTLADRLRITAKMLGLAKV